jgi:hypothetical protein
MSLAVLPDNDRREVFIETDRVASENRIQISDEVFTCTPRANGVLFPIVVHTGYRRKTAVQLTR